jgi:aminopeptidase YwaD
MPALEQRLLTHVRYLSEAIGPRLAGSPGCHAAADYIAASLSAAGLSVERQTYSCPAWDCHGTELSLDGMPLVAAANAFSPPCDVRAATLPLGTLTALEAADIAGRMVVLYGELAVPLPAKAAALRDELGARVVAALEAGRPAAVLTLQPGEAMLPRLIEDPELAIPSATVPARAGLAILRNPCVPARLRIFSARHLGTSANIVGRFGDGPGRLLVCAYYDTKIDTPGATDSAGAVAVLLELARALAVRRLDQRVELVALSGKCYPPSGDAVYSSACGDTLSNLSATLRFDGVGQALGATGVALGNTTPTQEALIRAAVSRLPQIVWPATRLAQPDAQAALRRLPSIVIGGVGGMSLAHTRDDTAKWIDPARLAEALTLGLEIVDLLEGRSSSASFPTHFGLVA